MAADELREPQLQPYVHDIVVSVTYRRKVYKFRAFFKRHTRLPINQAIQNLAGVNLEGDVLVVACGKKVEVRNLRGRDERRALDIAMHR